MSTNNNDPKTNAALETLEAMRRTMWSEAGQYLMVFDDQTMADFITSVQIPEEQRAYNTILDHAIKAEAKYLEQIMKGAQ
jgi:lipopolysaccharide biosynthesis glycosyltransferase